MEKELSVWNYFGSLIFENLANILTALRIWIFCCMGGLFFIIGSDPWSDHRFFWLVFLAALTDLFDGMIARWVARRTGKQTTDFGAGFDKAADKLGEACFFSIIAVMAISAGYSWLAWFLVPIVITELFLAGAWVYGYRNGKDAKAGYWGKRKMAWFFFVCGLWMMPNNYWLALKDTFGLDISGYFYYLFAISLCIGCILAIMSFRGYLARYAELQ